MSIAAPPRVFNLFPDAAEHITGAGGYIGELLGADAAPGKGPGSWCWDTQIRMLSDFVQGQGRLRGDPGQSFAPSLQGIVNECLAATTAPYLTWSQRVGSFDLRLSPRSLIGALWLQAALAITERKVFRNCLVCGRPIEISRSGGARTDAMFCSNSCKSRDYRARRAKAKKLADRGWKPTRIAKKLRSDTRTVRGWLTGRS